MRTLKEIMDDLDDSLFEAIEASMRHESDHYFDYEDYVYDTHFKDLFDEARVLLGGYRPIDETDTDPLITVLSTMNSVRLKIKNHKMVESLLYQIADEYGTEISDKMYFIAYEESK